VAILLLTGAVGLHTLWQVKRCRQPIRGNAFLLTVCVVGVSLLCLTIAGEEASWGQHFFGWGTPEGWRALNDQHETNLHNIGSWADQKPRAVVELTVMGLGIGWPLLGWIVPTLGRSRLRVLLPPRTACPTAVLAAVVALPDRLPGWFGPRLLELFPRPSELQEVYFYLFFAICMFAGRGRLLEQLREQSAAETPAQSLPVGAHDHRRAA
jgi:hypothetical protein